MNVAMSNLRVNPAATAAISNVHDDTLHQFSSNFNLRSGADSVESNMSMSCDTDAKVLFQSEDAKPWMKRPGAPAKVAPDVKRRRKNFRAKKMLKPKHPLMLLNELKPGLEYTVSERVVGSNQVVFRSTVNVDGTDFSGEGASKKQAHLEAAEAALKGLYYDKLMELWRRNDTSIEMKETDDITCSDDDGDAKLNCGQDDFPWGGLASLAMYKLVELWQTPREPLASSSKQVVLNTDVSTLKAKIPDNAAEMDPVMLLQNLSPQSKFSEKSRDVRDGVTEFTLTVEFNGVSYVGSALKKKIAKKICAKSALKSIGVTYDDNDLSSQFVQML